jgi:hypothetical protein
LFETKKLIESLISKADQSPEHSTTLEKQLACTLYGNKEYLAFIQETMPPEKITGFLNHCKHCPSCLKRLGETLERLVLEKEKTENMVLFQKTLGTLDILVPCDAPRRKESRR